MSWWRERSRTGRSRRFGGSISADRRLLRDELGAAADLCAVRASDQGDGPPGCAGVPFDPPSCVFRRVAGLPLVTDCRFAPDRRFMTTAQRAQDRAAAGL